MRLEIARPQSIKAYLTIGAILFFAIALSLGVFGVTSLRYVNALSEEISKRWLPNTMLVGDFNNLTSDFPASERASLLALNQQAISARLREMRALDRGIQDTQKAYENVGHAPSENALYRQFSAKWRAYRTIVDREMSLLQASRKQDAIELYHAQSERAYNSASDALGLLTNLTSRRSQTASQRAESAFATAQLFILLSMVCVGALMAATIGYTLRRILNPLLTLSVSIRRLAGNDMSVEIEGVDRPDEIGEMARAVAVFRNNAIDLASSRRSLLQQAAMLEEKLAEEQRLSVLQRNFVSMVSHEFRTPLTTIDMHAQRLKKIRESSNADDFAQRVQKIRSAVLHLTNLINDMIETSRMDEPHLALYFHPKDVDLVLVLKEVCQFHRDISSRIISEKFGNSPIILWADPRLLFQVFGNLLSNAIKYSPAGKAIAVEAEMHSDHVEVVFRDFGLGIPKEEIPHLFERFYRGSNAAHIGGAGIGLYFVKSALELHSGAISVESELGRGSVFRVRLPCKTRKYAESPRRQIDIARPAQVPLNAPTDPGMART